MAGTDDRPTEDQALLAASVVHHACGYMMWWIPRPPPAEHAAKQAIRLAEAHPKALPEGALAALETCCNFLGTKAIVHAP